MADDDKKSSNVGGKSSNFNGSNWEMFATQIALYFVQNKDKIKTDVDKITCVLLFMKGGTVATWAQHKFQIALLDPTTGEFLVQPNFGTFTAFWKECIERFGNKNIQLEAHAKILSLRQGSHTVVEYFQLLDQYIMQAGYSSDSFDTLLKRVHVAIDSEVALEIVKVIPEIKTYQKYKE
jgi:hypothetical protein